MFFVASLVLLLIIELRFPKLKVFNINYTYIYISENCGHPGFIFIIKEIKTSSGLYWVVMRKLGLPNIIRKKF